MDRKSLAIVIASGLLLILWGPLQNAIWPPKPIPVEEQQATGNSSTNTLAGTNAPVTNISSGSTNAIPAALPQTGTLQSLYPEPEELLTVENDVARFIFTSHGGGLHAVELKKYDKEPGCEEDSENAGLLLALNQQSPLAILAFGEDETFQGDGIFSLNREGETVTATKTLDNGLRLVHRFVVGTNYSVEASATIENRGAEAVRIPAFQRSIGAAVPSSAGEITVYDGLMWFDGEDKTEITESWFNNRTLGCFPGTPRTQYMGGPSVVWGSVNSQFFSIITKPKTPATQIHAEPIDAGIADKKGRPMKGYRAMLEFENVVIEPGTGHVQNFEIYAGPKEYKTVSKLGDRREYVMGFGAFFGIFSKMLLVSMNTINAIGFSYGWSIIIITFIIKMLFWPLTHASTKSMKRMSLLQPQMKALQEKYKDDPQKMNKKLMEFMKENKVNPMGGCLPMLLQMPVFIGFFYMIKSAVELRGASFLWACDLSQSDTLFHIAGFPVNPMPLLMGATMFFQARMTPPAPGMDPMQANMMRYMPMIFVVFLYNFSSGLTLYWTVSNILTIVQNKITKTATNTPSDAAAAAKPVAKKGLPTGKRRKK